MNEKDYLRETAAPKQKEPTPTKIKVAFALSIVFLALACLSTFAFKRTIEDQMFFLRLLEILGGYSLIPGLHNFKLFCSGLIVISVALFISHIVFTRKVKKYYEYREYMFFRKYKFVFLIFAVVTVAGHMGFKTINRTYLSCRKGLNSVVLLKRGRDIVGYSEYSRVTGGYEGAGYCLSFLNCGNETLYYNMKFVEIGNPENEVVLKKADGEIVTFTLYPGFDFPAFFGVEAFAPEYYQSETREIPKYYIVIYNENSSKTFYTYFDEGGQRW